MPVQSLTEWCVCDHIKIITVCVRILLYPPTYTLERTMLLRLIRMWGHKNWWESLSMSYIYDSSGCYHFRSVAHHVHFRRAYKPPHRGNTLAGNSHVLDGWKFSWVRGTHKKLSLWNSDTLDKFPISVLFILLNERPPLYFRTYLILVLTSKLTGN